MKTRHRHTKLRCAMDAFGPQDHFDGDIAHDQPTFVDCWPRLSQRASWNLIDPGWLLSRLIRGLFFFLRASDNSYESATKTLTTRVGRPLTRQQRVRGRGRFQGRFQKNARMRAMTCAQRMQPLWRSAHSIEHISSCRYPLLWPKMCIRKCL